MRNIFDFKHIRRRNIIIDKFCNQMIYNPHFLSMRLYFKRICKIDASINNHYRDTFTYHLSRKLINRELIIVNHSTCFSALLTITSWKIIIYTAFLFIYLPLSLSISYYFQVSLREWQDRMMSTIELYTQKNKDRIQYKGSFSFINEIFNVIL